MHQEQKLDEKQKSKEVTLLQNFKSELQEAKAQAVKLKDSLTSLQEFEKQIKSSSMKQNQDANLNYFDNELNSKIKNFAWDISQFEQGCLELNNNNIELTIEEIIQRCQDISDKMNKYYKEYQLLWTQCYYQRLRKQLKSNELKQEQSDLISYILS